MRGANLDQDPRDEEDFHFSGTDYDPDPTAPPPFGLITPACPKCESPRVDTRNLGRKTGATVGAIAGATGGAALALSSSEGDSTSIRAVPLVVAIGTVAGAVMGGIVGGAAGCATGSAFGELVDERVLNNFRCHACGHTFSRTRASV